MVLFMCLLLLGLQDSQVLVLSNGQFIVCTKYERANGQVTIYRDGQVFRLPDKSIDWPKTEQEQQKQAEPTKPKPKVKPAVPKPKADRAPIVLTNDNFKSSSPTLETIRVPFTSIGNTVIVDITINGQGPYQILVDTGASITVIEPDLALRLGTRGGRLLNLSGVGGGIQSEQVKLDEISIGGAIQKEFMVAAHAIEATKVLGVIGLLGQDFLGRYRMELDSVAKTMALTPHGITPMPSQASQIEALNRLVEEQPGRMQQFRQAYDQLNRLYQTYMKGARPDGVSSTLSSVTASLNDFKNYSHRVEQSLGRVDKQTLTADQKRAAMKFTACFAELDSFLREAIQLSQLMKRSFSSPDANHNELDQKAVSLQREQRSYESCQN